MTPLVILAILIIVPVLLIVLLRSNAAVVFFALCAGTVLLQYVGPTAVLILQGLQPHGSIILTEVLQITLLLSPALATIILMRKKARGLRLVLHIFPAITVGCLTALSVIPLISVVTRGNIMHSRPWNILESIQDLVVGAGVLLSLILIKSGHGKSPADHGKHGK